MFNIDEIYNLSFVLLIYLSLFKSYMTNFIKINLKIVILIIFSLHLANCAEKTSYSGKIFNLNTNIYNLNTIRLGFPTKNNH